MPKTWTLPSISDADLHEAERAILQAFDSRSTNGLNILGMGELGLAIGWPTNTPVAVLKRQAPGPEAQLAADMERMNKFNAALSEAGALVIPTEVRTIRNDYGAQIPYLIQPVIDSEDLAENVLAAAHPSPEDPILVSIRDTDVNVVTDGPEGGLSMDAQVTNFAWNGEDVVCLDTTPPLIWPAGNGPMDNVGNYLTAVPYLLRPAALHLTRKSGEDYRTVRGVLQQTAVYLMRIDQHRWVDSAIACFNEALDIPLARTGVDDAFNRVIRDLPTIKRLARVQRLWATKVRKQRYEFFITNSFTGEIY